MTDLIAAVAELADKSLLVLDDDAPLASRPIYLLRLAVHARTQGLGTGICWGLPAVLRRAVIAAQVRASLQPA